jgi:hypothetical protein
MSVHHHLEPLPTDAGLSTAMRGVDEVCLTAGLSFGQDSASGQDLRPERSLFWAPAACWWARTMVESIICSGEVSDVKGYAPVMAEPGPQPKL